MTVRHLALIVFLGCVVSACAFDLQPPCWAEKDCVRIPVNR